MATIEYVTHIAAGICSASLNFQRMFVVHILFLCISFGGNRMEFLANCGVVSQQDSLHRLHECASSIHHGFDIQIVCMKILRKTETRVFHLI